MEGSRLCSNPLSQRDGMQARAGKCAEQAGRNDRARLDNHVLPPCVSLWYGAAIIRREPDPVQQFIMVAGGVMGRLPIWARYSFIPGPKPPVGSTQRRFIAKKSGIQLPFCLKCLFPIPVVGMPARMPFRRKQDGLARLTHSDIHCSGSLFCRFPVGSALFRSVSPGFASLSSCIVSICSE